MNALRRVIAVASEVTANETGGGRVVVACFCATFLPAETLHVYRQIVSLRRWRPAVLTWKRQHAARFPFPEQDLTVLRRSPWRELRRFWYRRMRAAPVPLSARETRALLEELDRREAALLHVYFGNVAARLLPALRVSRRPVVVSFHGADVLVGLDQPAHRRATVEVLQRATLVLARSESLLDGLRALGCPREKLRLHRAGIPLAEFPFHPRDWATAAANGRWRLLQAGRLIPKKGLATTLRAFAEFLCAWPAATLTLAGDGPLLEPLRALTRELGIASRVEFTGFLSQEMLREKLDAAHFFLHPSELGPDGNQEGVPNALLEAMSSGLLALATRHGGIPEAITHGATGWLVDEGDAGALAAGLRSLADESPARLSQMANAAAIVVAKNFSQTQQVARLESLYDEALKIAG